jgi:hypothetical protein
VSTDINDLQMPASPVWLSQSGKSISFLSICGHAAYTVPSTAGGLLPSRGHKQIVDAPCRTTACEPKTPPWKYKRYRPGWSGKPSVLTKLGINHASLIPTNALETYHESTEIIDFGGKAYTADRIASWLGIPKERVRKGSEADLTMRTSQADIVVILGNDAKLESAVAASPPR